MTFDLLIFVLEMIGTVAFAISGVLVAKEKKMDIFGAVFLGCTTAVGGGVMRDLILGQTPPAMFTQPIYVLVSFVTCLLCFVWEKLARKKQWGEQSEKYKASDWSLNAADSVGLAAFVVVGCRAAADAGFGDNHFLTVFVGTITGIGGGILRDMMAGQIPLIFSRRVYGIAAIAGAVIYTEMTAWAGVRMTAAFVSMAVIVLIRILAIHYRWNLPSFR